MRQRRAMENRHDALVGRGQLDHSWFGHVFWLSAHGCHRGVATVAHESADRRVALASKAGVVPRERRSPLRPSMQEALALLAIGIKVTARLLVEFVEGPHLIVVKPYPPIESEMASVLLPSNMRRLLTQCLSR